jgi:hypothetical protein
MVVHDPETTKDAARPRNGAGIIDDVGVSKTNVVYLNSKICSIHGRAGLDIDGIAFVLLDAVAGGAVLVGGRAGAVDRGVDDRVRRRGDRIARGFGLTGCRK